MSSILDALKKSEAERQRGTPPTLDSPIVFQRRPAPTRRRPAWLLPVLAVAAVAGAWYGGLLPWPAPAEPAAGPTAAAPAEVGTGAVNPGKDPAAEPMLAPEPVPTAPAPDATGQASAPGRGIFGGAAGARDASPAAADGAGVETAPAAAPPAVAATPPPAPAAETAAAPTPVGPDDQALPAPTPSVSAAEPGAPEPAGPDAGPPSIHELPFAVRRELPELNVTMHMYSVDPQRRFVLLNGVRARDGDALDGGLEVVEIRAADIVLRFQGNEFVLPLRG